jgi:hypothetical protein
MDRKEAIEKARELLACGALSQEACDAIKRDFPELQESEDERTRKNILALVKKHAVNHERCQMEAYLEKQKEQKLVEWATMQDFNYHDGEPDKKAWSRLIAILNYAEATSDDTPGEEVQALINWIESKRQVQKPAGWSEEDEHRRTDAIYFLETAREQYALKSAIDEAIDWLKSLRPLPNWKPSEAQKNALKEVLDMAEAYGILQKMGRTYDDIIELQNDLEEEF